MFRFSVIAASLLLSSLALADISPYAGQQTRSIKALSDAEIDGLVQGQGMELAKPAELNGYPGPTHVLDIAADLRLNADQIPALQSVKQRMTTDAKAVGAEIIEQEGRLDRLFAEGTVDREKLSALTLEIGELRSRLRAIHLSAHLDTKAILTADQVVMYDVLRGYKQLADPQSHQPGNTGGHGTH